MSHFKIKLNCIFLILLFIYVNSIYSQDIIWEKIGPIRINNEPVSRINSVCAIDDSLYWISALIGPINAGRNVLMKSTDAGRVWDTVSFPNPKGPSFLQFLDEKYAIATVGFDSGVYKTTNGGKSWTQKIIGNDIVQIVSAFIKDTNNFYIACHDNGSNGYHSGNTIIAISNDGGENWSLKPVPNSWIISMKFYDNYGVLACKEGSVFLTQNNGKDFQELKLSDSALPGYNYGSALLDSNNIVIGASDGSIYFSNDFGKKWIKSLHGLNVYHMNTANSSFIIAGSWSSISISNDKGKNWTSEQTIKNLFSGTKSLVTTSSFTKTGIGLIAGWDSIILKRTGNIKFGLSRQKICISDTFSVTAEIDLGITIDSISPLIVELSDSSGSFKTPIRIGTFNSKSLNNKYVCTLLESSMNQASDKYKLRLYLGKRKVGSDVNVTIIAQPKPLIKGPVDLNRGVSQEYSVDSISGESYSWKALGDVKIIGATDASKVLIQTNSDGNFELRVKAINSGGCQRETSILVNVYGIVTVNDNFLTHSFNNSLFNISPNPTGESDQFIIRFAENQHQDISIELLDILGSVHYSHTLKAGSESCTIPVQGLSSGMYMLRVRMNNEVFIEKVIVN